MRLILVVVAGVVLVGCKSDEADFPVRLDSAGVEVLTLLGVPRQLRSRVDTLRILGGEDTGPLGFFRVREALVDVDDGGLIYLLDQSQHQVVVFSETGQVVRVFGSEGQGPGEFSYPISLSVTGSGTVSVHDAGRARIVTFGPDGSLLHEGAGPPTVISTGLRHTEITPSGTVMWVRDPFQGSDARQDRLIMLSGHDTVDLIEGRGAQTSTAHHPKCGMTYTAPVPLAARLLWAQWNEYIVVAHDAGFGFDVFRSGQLIRTVDRPEDRTEITQGQAVERLGQRAIVGPCASDPSDYVAKHGFNPRPQLISDVSLLPDGTIWAVRSDELGEETWVFDAAGRPVGVAAMPKPIAFLPNGRALVAIVDSLDVERLGVVRVTVPAGASS